jgi:hypothetical protein
VQNLQHPHAMVRTIPAAAVAAAWVLPLPLCCSCYQLRPSWHLPQMLLML